MMKKTLFILSMLVAVLSLSAQDIYEVTASRLNVRNTPSQQGAVVGFLTKGTLVEIVGTNNQWAEIIYKNKKAYISAQYITLKYRVLQDPVSAGSIIDSLLISEPVAEVRDTLSNIVVERKQRKSKKVKQSKISKEQKEKNTKKPLDAFWDKWSIDFLPSIYVGVSDFMGDYSPTPQCGWGTDMNFQLYNHQSHGFPKGYLAETSVGYAMKGGGGFTLHYFTLHLLPIGYRYDVNEQWSVIGVTGITMGFGGGHIYAHGNGTSRNFYGYPFDLGMQLKVAAEYRKIGVAVSYDQGFLDAVEPDALKLLNWGVNIHFYYRLWDLPHNKINKLWMYEKQ